MNIYAIPGIVSTVQPRDIKKQMSEDDFKLFEEICSITGHEPKEVLKNNKKRLREYVIIRQVMMSALYIIQKRSLSYAGSYFSKNHATAVHALRTVAALLETDKMFRYKYGHLFIGKSFPQYGNYSGIPVKKQLFQKSKEYERRTYHINSLS